MWPFRNLKLELDQAERANATLRQKIHDTNTEWRKAYADICQETCKEKDCLQKALRDTTAEYEIATNRYRKAHNIDANWAACQNKLAAARLALQGAMARDSKHNGGIS